MITYHLSAPLVLKLDCPSKTNLLSFAATASEKSALEILLKQQKQGSDTFVIPTERSFEILKGLATSGRVFYEGKKVLVDPFTYVDLYVEVEKSLVQGCWKMGSLKGPIQECALIVPSNPSWILKDGFIRPIKEEISSRWVKWAAAGPRQLTPLSLPS